MSGTKSGFSQPAIGDGPAPKRVGPLAARDSLEVRFGGTAEQGVAIMGVVLATAATRDHRYVAQTQTHGLEEGEGQGYSDALGHSDVIISDDPVDYPELLGIDLLVALGQGVADANVSLVRPDGVFIYDSESVSKPPNFQGTSYGIPFGRLAREAAGKGQVVPELLVLGAAVAITGVVSAESLVKTLKEIALAGPMEAKKRALSCGLDLDTTQWRRGSECS
jgi:2-oxoglutarate ferredoxin oxidoreductase subunit gamma